jgi:hypothetical protein
MQIKLDKGEKRKKKNHKILKKIKQTQYWKYIKKKRPKVKKRDNELEKLLSGCSNVGMCQVWAIVSYSWSLF